MVFLRISINYVQIPKCLKGRGIGDSLKHFFNGDNPTCDTLVAETKYDGYRLQIHVQIGHDGTTVTVFSKSKRNSTIDRRNTHSIVLAALGIPLPDGMPVYPTLASRLRGTPAPTKRVKSSVILEMEAVPFNEGAREGDRGPGIEEFWWLEAAGVTAGAETGRSRASHIGRHLCLVFFDILHLDGENLLTVAYHSRRSLLKSVVRPIHGFSMFAMCQSISLDMGKDHARLSLKKAFDTVCDGREGSSEGLVLKADSSTYNDPKLPWVKLKKDYIQGLGDTIDLVLLGAGWDIDRARELRVDTSVFTTFYLGVLTNREDVYKRRHAPYFEILFRVSYGLNRDQLELYNDQLRLGRWASKPFDKDDPWKRRLIGLSWKYHMPKSMVPPSVLLEAPLCAEVMGAGFQRLPFSELYELRWPRLMKIFEKKERAWTAALSSRDLISTARQALGYDQTTASLPVSPERDSIGALWRSHSTVAVVVIAEIAHAKNADALRLGAGLKFVSTINTATIREEASGNIPTVPATTVDRSA
ncbi:DNA ligase 1 [Vanrija pseudolonga]|uniref:DNA ligase 1 n=1 Tax=Vanrija pseudolonga TaxID=143232 RepID=A0AAF0Y3X2_9TREE|nr:DNA ligase 1 [Vanrija pseudolonga]